MLQSYALGYLLPWRTMAFVLAYQPPLLLLCLLLLPESPQWLALQGRREEASASLSWARGTEFLNVADMNLSGAKIFKLTVPGPAWPLGNELEEMLTR